MENEIEWLDRDMNFQATDSDGEVYQYSHRPFPNSLDLDELIWNLMIYEIQGVRGLVSGYIGCGEHITPLEALNSLVERNRL